MESNFFDVNMSLEWAITLKQRADIPFDDNQEFLMTTSIVKDRKKPKDEQF